MTMTLRDRQLAESAASAARYRAESMAIRAEMAGREQGHAEGLREGKRLEFARSLNVIRPLIRHLRARTSQKEYLRRELERYNPNHPMVNPEPIDFSDSPELAAIVAQYDLPDEVVRESFDSLLEHGDGALVKAAGGITLSKGDMAAIQEGALSGFGEEEESASAQISNRYHPSPNEGGNIGYFNRGIANGLTNAYILPKESTPFYGIFSLGLAGFSRDPDYRALKDGLGDSREIREQNLKAAIATVLAKHSGLTLVGVLQEARNGDGKLPDGFFDAHINRIVEDWLLSQREKHGQPLPASGNTGLPDHN